MQDIKITLIQSNLAWEDKLTNLTHFEHKIRSLKIKGDLLVLPEMFNTAFSMKPELFAELPQGETWQWMKTLSHAMSTSIAGSFMVNEEGKYYNRFVVMHPNGDFEQYDKRHLFRMGNEHQHFSAGDKSLIFEFKGWKIKALICYDLRFPVFAKNNFHKGIYDYDALLFVANWPKVRNHIWTNLLLARALENQVYVIAVNRIGEDGNGLDHAGSSCIINPRGEYIIEPKESIAFEQSALLSYAELQDFRTKFTVGLDWDKFEIN